MLLLINSAYYTSQAGMALWISEAERTKCTANFCSGIPSF